MKMAEVPKLLSLQRNWVIRGVKIDSMTYSGHHTHVTRLLHVAQVEGHESTTSTNQNKVWFESDQSQASKKVSR